MKIKTILLSLTALLSSLSSFAANPSDWAQLSRYAADNKRIIASGDTINALFFGDSITDSWATMEPAFFKHNKFLGRGISGQSTYQFVERFQNDAIDLHPKIIVLNGATNDIAENTHPYSEDATVANFRKMIEMAKANGIELILTSTLPAARFKWNPAIKDAPEKIEALNQRLRQLAEEYDLLFVNYHVHLLAADGRSLDPRFTKDGVHPTKKGYGLMEEIIWYEVMNVLNYLQENQLNKDKEINK